MYRVAAILFTFCGVFSVAIRVDAQSQTTTSLPKEIREAIKKNRSVCESWKQLPGFISQRDINGDGIKDFILDYEKIECDDSASAWCGSAGCLTQVFASLPDGGFVEVLNTNVRGLKFSKVSGRPAMLLDLHGTVCGRAGAAPCGETLYWNGYTFSPAN